MIRTTTETTTGHETLALFPHHAYLIRTVEDGSLQGIVYTRRGKIVCSLDNAACILALRFIMEY